MMKGGLVDKRREAKVIDSHLLKLKTPINIAPGSNVIVTIQPAEGVSENQEWYLLSSQGLEKAFGENEPDYPLEMIKTFNPEYRP
jgi:hypothetical protein